MRVVTWNVLWRDRNQRLDALCRCLAAVRPDVVLLQETSPDHAAAVAQRLDLAAIAVPPRDRIEPMPGTDTISVPAILARRLDRKKSIKLTGGGPACWLITAAVPGPDGGAVRIGSVHLAATRAAGRMTLDPDYLAAARSELGHEAIREPGLRESVATRLQQLATVRAEFTEQQPWLLAGDCNFVPAGIEHRHLLRSGAVDAWEEGPRPGSRCTIVAANPLVAETAADYPDLPPGLPTLDYTLDFQFHSGHGAALAGWTIGVPAPGLDWPSDHLGLAVDYAWRPRRR